MTRLSSERVVMGPSAFVWFALLFSTTVLAAEIDLGSPCENDSECVEHGVCHEKGSIKVCACQKGFYKNGAVCTALVKCDVTQCRSGNDTHATCGNNGECQCSNTYYVYDNYCAKAIGCDNTTCRRKGDTRAVCNVEQKYCDCSKEFFRSDDNCINKFFTCDTYINNSECRPDNYCKCSAGYRQENQDRCVKDVGSPCYEDDDCVLNGYCKNIGNSSVCACKNGVPLNNACAVPPPTTTTTTTSAPTTSTTNVPSTTLGAHHFNGSIVFEMALQQLD